MKRFALFLLMAGAAISMPACSPSRPEIELTSNDFDLSPLVGKWSGDYSSKVTGRSGTISFTLEAGEAAAFGNVVFQPRPLAGAVAQPIGGSMTGGQQTVAVTPRQLLTIHFVRKEDKRVVGVLDPYTDPECACTLTTTFQGEFTDSRTIEGTYSSVAAGSTEPRATGTWKVTRVKRL